MSRNKYSKSDFSWQNADLGRIHFKIRSLSVSESDFWWQNTWLGLGSLESWPGGRALQCGSQQTIPSGYFITKNLEGSGDAAVRIDMQ